MPSNTLISMQKHSHANQFIGARITLLFSFFFFKLVTHVIIAIYLMILIGKFTKLNDSVQSYKVNKAHTFDCHGLES